MENTPRFKPDSVIESVNSRNLLKAAIVASAAFGCAQPQTALTKSPVAAASAPQPKMASIQINPAIEERIQSPDMEDEGVEGYEITVIGEVPNKPWPGVPSACAFSGIVLDHDTSKVPHEVLLENRCIQERGMLSNVFDGNHRWVTANKMGHYEIPFYQSYLKEKGESLYFVTNQDGQTVEAPLKPGSYAPNTLTFFPYLKEYGIMNME